MSLSLIILIVVLILAIVLWKVQKKISLILFGAIGIFILAYLFVPDFQGMVRGKGKDMKSRIQEKVMDAKDKVIDKVKDKVKEKITP